MAPKSKHPSDPTHLNSWHKKEAICDCVQLARSENIGPVTFQWLMQSYTSPAHAIAALPKMAEKSRRGKAFKLASRKRCEEEVAITHARCGQILVWGSKDYPRLLSQIPAAPPILAAFGHIALATRPCIAIVGGRNASAAGLTLAKNISAELSRRGFVTVSGLARGVDTIVHKASLEGGTIAVIANGILSDYPPENQPLKAEIEAAGLLICENPPDTKPQATLFPSRNKIIAGIAQATLVIEAARRSGSLITARLANEFGRDVMASPGSPLDPRCHGSNNLLRTGAILVETADDVIEALSSHAGSIETNETERQSPLFAPIEAEYNLTDRERRQIIELLGPTPMDINDIVSLSQIPLPLIYQTLIELELSGRLIRNALGQVSLDESSS